MKIVQKLAILLIVGTSTVLAINGFLRVRREVNLFESNRAQNQNVLATAIASSAGAVWRTDGPDRARALVERLDARTEKQHIWVVDLAAPGSEDATVVTRLRAGEAVSMWKTVVAGKAAQCSYAPIPTPNGQLAAVGVCEPLASQEVYLRHTIEETVATTLALALVCGLISTLLGIWVVGRPIAALMEKARRIGEGDFSHPVQPPGNDEIAMLSDAMNVMCDRLASAAERVASETRSRIAAVEQLRHADRLMTVGKLASGLAHELGTPLNVIEARADMIANGEAEPEQIPEFARVISEAAERMTRIVRQLLDFGRRGRSQTLPHDVLSLAKRTYDLLAPLAAKKRVRVTVEGVDTAALVDPDQIQQVFTNLIVNAIHATASDHAIAVSVSESRTRSPQELGGDERDCVCVTVRDEGAGITPENLSRIFEPFFTTKGVGEGTGLGLAVAYGIVRDHRGWIDVKSQVGHGSEFAVFLEKAS